MAGHPARNLSVRRAVSRSGRATCENLRRGSPTAITRATRITTRLASQRSKSMRGRHDNHRRFEVPATNGSRPIAGGRLCGGKVSELFHTGEWICGRSDRCREALDRLLLFGWLLSQRDPIELSCEGVMRRPEVCKHQVFNVPPLLDIRQQGQISKAREITIGSDFLAIRRNFDVDSIFACPKSIRTASKSPVPFKIWRAFVRRKDSLPYFLGSSPASATQNFSRRFICRTVIGRGSA